MLTTFSRTVLLSCAVAASLTSQSVASKPGDQVQIRFASFDPATETPDIPVTLRSARNQSMRIVQFVGIPTEEGRQAIALAGGKIIGYLPSNSYVVRMTAEQAAVYARRGAKYADPL